LNFDHVKSGDHSRGNRTNPARTSGFTIPAKRASDGS
jgi:hypothetical protein